MTYELSEHRHRFAVWAVARATQRGFTTVKRLQEALEASTTQQALADQRTRALTAARLDALRRESDTQVVVVRLEAEGR